MSEAYHEFCSIGKIPQVGNQLICEKDAIYPHLWLWTNCFISMGLSFLIFKMKIGKNNFLGWQGDILCVTAGLITQGNPAHLPGWTRGYSLWSQGLSPSCWHLSWRKSSQREQDYILILHVRQHLSCLFQGWHCLNLDSSFITSLLIVSTIVGETQGDMKVMALVAKWKSSQNV